VTLDGSSARPAATWAAKEKIPRAGRQAGFQILGWLMGLEPTTTGITILFPYFLNSSEWQQNKEFSNEIK
jgi:hypothetical protein